MGSFGFIQYAIFLLVFTTIVESQKGLGKTSPTSARLNNKGSYGAGGLGYQSSPEPTGPTNSQTKKSGGGIGAWGYIAIVLTVIVSGMGIYYFIIFYPIMCKKARMYDVMEMTTV